MVPSAIQLCVCFPTASPIESIFWYVKRVCQNFFLVLANLRGEKTLSQRGFFFFKNIYYFIYLTVPGLSCNTQNLPSSLWLAGSLVVACELCCDMWDLGPWPGTEPKPPVLGTQFYHWTPREILSQRVLTFFLWVRLNLFIFSCN